MASVAAAAIAEPRLWRDSRLLCWTLMPDHWHGLIELGTTETLSKLMRRVKSVTARAINRQLGSEGVIWMPAYHDRAVRRDEDLRTIARYVIANPIRARLVASVTEYPYWDAIWLDGQHPL